MIQANKDPKILIKEKDKYFWHVEQTRRDVKPGNDPTNVRITTWVKVYRTRDYKRIFEPQPTKRGRAQVAVGAMNLLPACGIREARLVHDPVLQREIEAREKAERNLRVPADDDMGAIAPDRPATESEDDGGGAKRPVRRKKTE